MDVKLFLKEEPHFDLPEKRGHATMQPHCQLPMEKGAGKPPLRTKPLLPPSFVMFYSILKRAAWSACLLASWAGALEISDLHLPLTRTEADDTLSKDYTYQILQDATIRRIWNHDDKTITIDFDPLTNEAICIVVSYKSAVPRKKGMADAKLMCQGKAEGARWLNTKSEAARKFGMKNSKVLPLTDGTFLFQEAEDGGKKFTRLSLFAKAPKGNRWELPTLEMDNRTALGNAVQNDNIKELFRDEERRLASGGPAVASRDTATVESVAAPAPKPVVSALGSTPGAKKTVEKTPVNAPKEVAGLAHVAAEEPDDAEKKAPSLMASLGFEQPGPLQYGIGGGILLLLILLIAVKVSANKRKTRRQAQFASVFLNSKPTSANSGGRATIKRR